MNEAQKTRINIAIDQYKRVGIDIIRTQTIKSNGINSSVHKIMTNHGGMYLLKLYRDKTHSDKRERRLAEKEFLKHIRSVGLETCPELISSDEVSNSSIIEWIEGETIEKHNKTSIDQTAEFLGRLALEKNQGQIRGLRDAAENYLTLSNIVISMSKREYLEYHQENDGLNQEEKWM